MSKQSIKWHDIRWLQGPTHYYANIGGTLHQINRSTVSAWGFRASGYDLVVAGRTVGSFRRLADAKEACR